jgi:hypothetical protein
LGEGGWLSFHHRDAKDKFNSGHGFTRIHADKAKTDKREPDIFKAIFQRKIQDDRALSVLIRGNPWPLFSL